VEKAIFLGPATVNIPLQKPTLSDLNLHTLTPETTGNTIRTRLARQFPQEGIDPPATWLLLDTLTEGQRYELRVCWAALVRIAHHRYRNDFFPLSRFIPKTREFNNRIQKK
jgi:hypothetical protein